MLTSNQLLLKANTSPRIFSGQILKRFADPLDCLTAHLMLECAEVLAGIKPANLISIVNRIRPCGRNLHRLWKHHHEKLASRLAGLTIIVLQDKERALLLLCYSNVLLERHLAHAGIRILLHKAGYEADASNDALLDELCRRISGNESFPHEIGLFIGYPAKDVAAFMGLIKLPFVCQCLWKVYGKPDHSLELSEQFRRCRQRMGAILATGNQAALKMNNRHHPFFCRPTENNYQFHGLNDSQSTGGIK